MPSKPTDIDALEITITGDGLATLSGINYNDLRSLLTAASLHLHDNPAAIPPLAGPVDEAQHESHLETFQWHLDKRLVLDVLHVRLSKAISPQYADGSIANIKSLHAHYVTELEETVRKAEAEAAAQPAPKPDPVVEATAAISKALREADAALAKLKHARSLGIS